MDDLVSTMTMLIWVLGTTLAASFLCSVLEAVFLSVTHAHVALMRGRGEWAGEWLAEARRKVDEPIAAILTLNTIAHTVGAVLGGAIAAEVFGSTWIGVFSAVLTLAILIFTEIIPKTVGATYWMYLAKPTAYILRALIIIMKPILVPLGILGRAIQPKAERLTVSRAELEVLAEIGRREGTFGEDEWRVVRNVISLEDTPVGVVMTPRTDIVAVSVDAGVDEAIEVMLSEGHMRVPVSEGDLDQIVGIVLARDLWQIKGEQARDIRGVVRPILFAPASKPVVQLIPEMRQQRTKMAIVVDEFGGTAGLVTLEDLMEEIVGEIKDEHDERKEFQQLAGGRLRIWAGVPLAEAGVRLAFEPMGGEEGFDSLGGYVFGRLNRIPEVGDRVDVGSGTLRVVRMQGRRIEYLLFEPHPSEAREVSSGPTS